MLQNIGSYEAHNLKIFLDDDVSFSSLSEGYDPNDTTEMIAVYNISSASEYGERLINWMLRCNVMGIPPSYLYDSSRCDLVPQVYIARRFGEYQNYIDFYSSYGNDNFGYGELGGNSINVVTKPYVMTYLKALQEIGLPSHVIYKYAGMFWRRQQMSSADFEEYRELINISPARPRHSSSNTQPLLHPQP